MPAILEPASRAALPKSERHRALANVAVVRTWWTVLENEWRTALLERGPEDAPDICRGGILEASVREALLPFEDFDARIEDLLARDDVVIASIALCGKLGGDHVSAHEAWVCRLAEGVIAEVRSYAGVEQAIAAVGAPQDAAPRHS
jgi:hypothetical protein